VYEHNQADSVDDVSCDHLGPIPTEGGIEDDAEPVGAPMLGIVGFVGLCSRVGALGNLTGSLNERSL
jgi:hypothetical protein